VWPTGLHELIAMVVCTLLLVVWAIVLKAPLEQPLLLREFQPVEGPWYFLGLQECSSIRPWMAGVVLPTIDYQRLIALPYIDSTQGQRLLHIRGAEVRHQHVLVRLRGAVVVLIVLARSARPNWILRPFEPWDPHKTCRSTTDLSDYFWLDMLGMSTERFCSGASCRHHLGARVSGRAAAVAREDNHAAVLHPHGFSSLLHVVTLISSCLSAIRWLRGQSISS